MSLWPDLDQCTDLARCVLDPACDGYVACRGRANVEEFAPVVVPEVLPCICPDPPVAVEGCPAHRVRYAFQRTAAELFPDDNGPW